MHRKILPILLLAVLLLVLLLVRGCGKDDGKTAADGQTQTADLKKESAQTGKVLLRGTVTASENGGIVLTIEKNGTSEVHTYTDIQLDDWFTDAVNCAVANEWMSGTAASDGTEKFRPDYGLTRAELAMILYHMADAEPVAARHTYSDVATDAWCYDCVSWADANGYLLPAEEETFGVDEFIVCEELLTALHRAAGEPNSAASLEDYPYAPKVSEEALTAVRWAWEKGLIAEDECVWYPTQAASRAQVALLLTRYNELAG